MAQELPLILRQSETTEKGKNTYSEVLKRHRECWLQFDWSEFRYLIVPDEASAKHTISVIKTLENMEESEKELLISKIEISRRFSDNM